MALTQNIQYYTYGDLLTVRNQGNKVLVCLCQVCANLITYIKWVILDFSCSFFKCSVQMLLYQLPKSQVYYSCCIMCALHVVIGVYILFLKIKCSYSVLPKHSVQLMLQLVVILSIVIFRCSFSVLVLQRLPKSLQ